MKVQKEEYTLKDFYYNLPERLIAQKPVESRDDSRLFLLNRSSGEFKHSGFKSFIEYLNKDDILVFNNTKVINARIYCLKKTGALLEIVLTQKISGKRWFVISNRSITCWGKEVEYESELGHQIDVQRLTNLGNHNLLENDERLSHEIGHAWLGNIIGFENGWIWEGFDHFNGIVALDFRLSFLSADLKDERLINHKTEPLNGMYEKYFPTDDAYAYYAKGGIFAYLVSRKLEIETDMNYSGFMKYLYDRYFLSQNRQAQLTLIQGIVPNFQTALNSFSGIDFSDLFTSYVTGNEDIIKELRFEKIYLPAFK